MLPINTMSLTVPIMNLGSIIFAINMVYVPRERVQRGHNFAIVDEVDSILIDEARTPLIISGRSENNSEIYKKINNISKVLSVHNQEQTPILPFDQSYLSEEEIKAQGHFILDEKNRSIELTENGHQEVERLLKQSKLLNEDEDLYASSNLALLHHVTLGLKAHHLFQKNVEYLVSPDKEVILIDENTGRPLPGRRLSDGLHQAIEARENVKIKEENQTLASTTFQNYFRIYGKLSGMTGTADTEAQEFKQIYNLDVVVVPPNMPCQRLDLNDYVYGTRKEKYHACVNEVLAETAKGRPVLIGTASVESSENVAQYLDKTDLKYKILNAKHHQREADIIAQAGRSGAVTIATNMAGRGTDIVLGGNIKSALQKEPNEEKRALLEAEWLEEHNKVVNAGGLHIIATERHESRRIDNQLRGRAGRQGDPGSSRFYLSFEDDLLRIFASERIQGIMKRLGMEEGQVMEHQMVTNAIERAQKKVEGRNFDIRKNLLEYDDVANGQRQVIYQQRADLLETEIDEEMVPNLTEVVFRNRVANYILPGSLPEQWEVGRLEKEMKLDFGLDYPVSEWCDEDEVDEEKIITRLVDLSKENYLQKRDSVGLEMFLALEKGLMLNLLDKKWTQHLSAMEHLRQSINLRAYGQKQPKQEYKREAFNLFDSFLSEWQDQVVSDLFRVKIKSEEEVEKERKVALESQRRKMQSMRLGKYFQ